MTHLIEKFTDILKKGRYNTQTIAAYRNALFKFYNEFREVPERQITDGMIADYLQDLKTKKNVSPDIIQQYGKAIKLFYELLFARKLSITIAGQIKEEQLIEVLSRAEVNKLLEVTDNVKHKALLSMVYATGMRLAEILNIKLIDVDFESNLIYIRPIKNEQGRHLTLANNLKDALQAHIEKNKPADLLFEGEKGKGYSPRSIQLVFQVALKKSGINKDVSIHSLRHSFAVHLLERGIDLHLLKEILGHKNVQTTSVYVPMAKIELANIKSPMDY
jgi:integrase/recombinase XerD